MSMKWFRHSVLRMFKNQTVKKGGIEIKVQLESGVWLTGKDDGAGAPPRTVHEIYAKDFGNMKEALSALDEARKYKPFKNAEIKTVLFE